MTRTRTALAIAAATLAVAAPLATGSIPHDAAIPPSSQAVETNTTGCAGSASEFQRFMCFRRAALLAAEAHNIPDLGGSGTR